MHRQWQASVVKVIPEGEVGGWGSRREPSTQLRVREGHQKQASPEGWVGSGKDRKKGNTLKTGGKMNRGPARRRTQTLGLIPE